MEYLILAQALELFGETESPLNRATRQFGQREATSQTILNETRGRKLWNNQDQASGFECDETVLRQKYHGIVVAGCDS
jgi:hypothetical protein